VSDDGGSSGRLREEFGIVPPGDLRMALAALCGDDTWGSTWARVLQHRFSSKGELDGHSLGNLLITALWEETDNLVEGLDWVARLLDAKGKVLPLCIEPLEIYAEVLTATGTAEQVRGQVQVARTEHSIQAIGLEPDGAVDEAVLVGPGSVPERVAVPEADVRRVLERATSIGAGVCDRSQP
jgi:uncharacterized cofD-like protein